jgi:hypothetical protein
MIDEGGFGCVFKGWIDEHTQAPTKPGTGFVIAVKRLNQESNQGHSEWLVSLILGSIIDDFIHFEIGKIQISLGDLVFLVFNYKSK